MNYTPLVNYAQLKRFGAAMEAAEERHEALRRITRRQVERNRFTNVTERHVRREVERIRREHAS